VRPRTVRTAPEKWSCSSTLSPASAVDRGASLNSKPLPLFPRKIEAIPFEQWAMGAPGTVCKSGQILALTGSRPPDSPDRSDNQTNIKVLI
jgi:hypothetical protein